MLDKDDIPTQDLRIWGAISFVLGLLISLPFERPRSTVIWASASLLIYTPRLYWRLRLSPLYWIVILAFVAAHAICVFTIRFETPKYPILIFLLPVGIADFLFMALSLKLLENILSKAK